MGWRCTVFFLVFSFLSFFLVLGDRSVRGYGDNLVRGMGQSCHGDSPVRGDRIVRGVGQSCHGDNSVRGDRAVTLSELLDGGSCLVDDVLVVFIGEDGGRIADVHPPDLRDLFLLGNKVIVFRPGDEVDHRFLRVPLGKIGHGLPEGGVDHDLYRGLLPDLPDSGLDLRLAAFHMPLGKGPVPAVDVLDEQDLRVPVGFAVHDRTAGFFMLHGFHPTPLCDDLSLSV